MAKHAKLSGPLQFTAISVIMAALCFFSYQVLYFHCLLWSCPPHRSFDLSDLDLPDELFPDDAMSSDFSRPSEPANAIEARTKNVSWNRGSGIAIYIVRRYGTIGQAQSAYEANLISSSNRTADKREVQLVSRSADVHAMVCGLSVNFGERCHFHARYDEYSVIYSSTIDTGVSEEQFIDVVRVIDATMSCKVKNACSR